MRLLDFKEKLLRLSLENITVLYLAFPILIFLIGWLKIIYLIPAVLLFFVTLFYVSKDLLSKEVFNFRKIERKKWIILFIVFLILLCWVSLSGSGQFGYQNGDYEKHNAILNDLVNRDWPVTYNINNQETPLVYYIAYYLPAALFGKVFGLSASIFVMYLWTLFGVLISGLWFLKLSKRLSVSMIFFFIFWGGLDIVGLLFFNNASILQTDFFGSWRESNFLLENWAKGMQYTSSTVLLFWVPQHALVGWLATSLIYSQINQNKFKNLIPVLSFVPLWSPFVFLGLIPYFVIFLNKERIKSLFNRQNFAALIILLITLLYLYAPNKNLASQWIWETYSPLALLQYGLAFIIFEILIWFALLNKNANQDKFDNFFLLTTFLALILIPIYKVGLNNDFAMRVSIPALFILSIFVVRSFNIPAMTRVEKLQKYLILVCIFLASFNGIFEIGKSIRNYNDHYDYKEITEINNSGPDVKLYLGSDDSIFFKYLAK